MMAELHNVPCMHFYLTHGEQPTYTIYSNSITELLQTAKPRTTGKPNTNGHCATTNKSHKTETNTGLAYIANTNRATGPPDVQTNYTIYTATTPTGHNPPPKLNQQSAQNQTDKHNNATNTHSNNKTDETHCKRPTNTTINVNTTDTEQTQTKTTNNQDRLTLQCSQPHRKNKQTTTRTKNNTNMVILPLNNTQQNPKTITEQANTKAGNNTHRHNTTTTHINKTKIGTQNNPIPTNDDNQHPQTSKSTQSGIPLMATWQKQNRKAKTNS
jgi:hypothetical protein